jgi:hypothetical protein
MDLDTARGLKQELLSFTDQIRIPTRDGADVLAPELAIGFAPTGRRGDVHIAVRAESEEDLPQSVIDELSRRTKAQIDIRYTGEITPLVASHVAPVAGPLEPGASIAHYRCGVGSLGFFARRASDDAIGIVSNNHVIAATDQGEDHDEIFHARSMSTRDVIAHLCGKYPRLGASSTTLDCAFAPLVRGRTFNAAPGGHRLARRMAAPTTELMSVSKIGRTTGQTYGRVTAFELDKVRVTYPSGRIVFSRQIEIAPETGEPFSRPGDSGALVFTYPDRQPLGLIFGGSLRGGTTGLGLTFANPIRSVLDALGVKLVR